MKANWKIALMCVAAITMVACKKDKNNEPTPAPGPDPSYVSPISVKDKSVADWDALKPEKVAVFNMTAEPYYDGLKQLKVYSDGVYINFILVFDPAKYVSHTPNDALHMYLDVDHSDATGGFFDEFADAAADLMFEGALFDDFGNPIPYSPSMYKWIGQEGGQPSERIGWEEGWGEPIGSVKGENQFVGDSIIEGRMLVDLISNKFAKEGFGIGFDLQQNFNSIGLLPQLDAQGENGEFIGRTNMLFVPFDVEEAE